MNVEQINALSKERKRVTGSEMKTWMRCKRKWFLAYHAKWGKIEPDFGKPTGLGTRVHNALETLYHPEKQHLTNEDILAELDAKVQEDKNNFPTWAAEIEKDGKLAHIMVEGYMEWLEETGMDAELTLIASEQGVEVALPPWDPNEVTLMAKLDGRVRANPGDRRLALEHKTVQSVKAPLPLLQIDFQLRTEHLVEFLNLIEEKGLDAAMEERVEGVLYNMLRKVKRTATAKPPFYAREEVHRNMEELRNHWAHVAAITGEILLAHQRLNAGEEHHTVAYPTATRDCTWDCPFFQICPLFDDGSDVNAALNDLYVHVDPLERYSRQDHDQEEVS
jgi:hypothetical protein